jgi:TldD protein
MQSPSKLAICCLTAMSLLTPTATAADDVVLRAMSDELDRSIKNLRIEQKAKPYFIGYRITDDKRLRLTYELGQKAEDEQQENRVAEIDMHAGDKTFDNTAELVGRGTRDRSRYLPLDDNYDAIRRHFWVLTDDSYKDAGEEYEKQDAYKRGHIIRNLTDSFSDAAPVQSISNDNPELKLTEDWDKRLSSLSAVFSKYPEIRKSWAVMEADRQVFRIANTDGTRVRFTWTPIVLGIAAFARCADGEDIWDCDYFRVVNEKDMPTQEELEARAKALAENLVAYTKAERKQYYFGPVLFEGQSSGELLQHGMAPKLVAMRGDNLHPQGTFLRLVDRRILPKFLNITDDPTCTSYEGKPIAGPYQFDDDGVPCKQVKVVEKGYLKELLSSRTPVLPKQTSNGHHFNNQVLPTTLMMTSDKPVPLKKMEANLLRIARDQGLKEAIIVRRIVPQTAKLMHGDAETARSDSLDGCNPLEVYSVDVATGKETRIRGLRFRGFGLSAMQGIVQAGNDARAYNTVNWAGYVRSVVAPSLLISHLEMEEDARNTLGPYPLENPYFAKK